VEAVLAEMDPPASYGKRTHPAGAAPGYGPALALALAGRAFALFLLLAGDLLGLDVGHYALVAFLGFEAAAALVAARVWRLAGDSAPEISPGPAVGAASLAILCFAILAAVYERTTYCAAFFLAAYALGRTAIAVDPHGRGRALGMAAVAAGSLSLAVTLFGLPAFVFLVLTVESGVESPTDFADRWPVQLLWLSISLGAGTLVAGGLALLAKHRRGSIRLLFPPLVGGEVDRHAKRLGALCACEFMPAIGALAMWIMLTW